MFSFFARMLIQMYLINTEQREHLKILRENSSDGIPYSISLDVCIYHKKKLTSHHISKLFQCQSKYVS